MSALPGTPPQEQVPEQVSVVASGPSPDPQPVQLAAQVKGRKRYEGFVETLGRRYASGKSLLDEIPEDIAGRDGGSTDT